MELNEREELVLTKNEKTKFILRYGKIMGSILVLTMVYTMAMIALVKMLFLPGVDLPLACLYIAISSIIANNLVEHISWGYEEIEYITKAMKRKSRRNRRRLK